MNWINVKDKHFVDIDKHKDGTYKWNENNNCPNAAFLVGLFLGNTFQYWLVVLSEDGLEEITEDGPIPLDIDITDIEYWCTIIAPVIK